MVNYSAQLARPFAAPVDPTRRAILARLEREDGASVSELARPFAIKLPAVMKHLDVLRDAGLITRSKAGRTVTVRLAPGALRGAIALRRRPDGLLAASPHSLPPHCGHQANPREKERRRGPPPPLRPGASPQQRRPPQPRARLERGARQAGTSFSRITEWRSS